MAPFLFHMPARISDVITSTDSGICSATGQQASKQSASRGEGRRGQGRCVGARGCGRAYLPTYLDQAQQQRRVGPQAAQEGLECERGESVVLGGLPDEEAEEAVQRDVEREAGQRAEALQLLAPVPPRVHGHGAGLVVPVYLHGTGRQA